MTRSESFRPEELAQHGKSLRRLARRLVRDPALAEDLVQEAYAAALASPPRAPGALPAWLARVVRNGAAHLRRGAARRAARERLAARPESAPATAAERMAFYGELFSAVGDLREPYRTAIVLRYCEDLPPREIARCLRVPVKTVKTRLARALEELRRSLDARHDGDRRAWAAGFVRFLPGPGLVRPLLFLQGKGMLAMSAKNAVAVVLLSSAALLGIWALGARGSRARPERSAPLAAAPAAAPEAASAQPAAEAVHEERRGALAPEPSTAAKPVLHGSLVVQAVYSDGTPAAGVALALRAEDDPCLQTAAVQVSSAEDGRARAKGLHPGRIALESDRGGSLRTTLAAGEHREVRFEIPRGVDVTGVVRDGDGRPVAGAGIWLTTSHDDWLGGRVVARAGARGEFFLRSVDPVQSVGARAPGFAPSELVDLELGEPGAERREVELRLVRAGAGLAGRVLGEGGAPLAGALVALGQRAVLGYRVDSTRQEAWSPEVACTGPDGAFRFDGAEPGDTLLSVRAEGYPPWSAASVLVSGETAWVEARLERGATVRGTVRDEDGATVAGALVQASLEPYDTGPWGVGIASAANAFGRAGARSDAAGAYELRLAPAGTIHLLAGGEGDEERLFKPWGTAEAAVDAAPGADLVWDPVLSLGLVIRGRIEWNPDGPRLMTIVAATPEVEGARPVSAFNDQQGRFTLAHCDAVPYTLVVAGTNMSAAGIWPGEGEIVLRAGPELASPATVRGRFVDSGARLGRGTLALRLESESSILGPEASLDGEAFLFSGIPPGRYSMVAFAADAFVRLTDRFEVLPGQDLDLGEIATRPGGALVVRVEARGGAAPVRPRAILGEGFDGRTIAWDGERFHAEGLEPGRHLLHVSEHGLYAPPLALEIRAGETTEARATLEPAVGVPVAVAAPPGDEPWDRIWIRVRDSSGALAWQRMFLRQGLAAFPLRITADLPAGTFTLSTELDTGRTRERAFLVPDLASPPAEVLIEP